MQDDGGHGATEGEMIRFKPNMEDVVSTKLRQWMTDHPGNVFYTDLLTEHVEKLLRMGQGEAALHFIEYSERIVKAIAIDRGGRFLRLPEGESNPRYCRLMTHKECINKVLNALKNAYQKTRKVPQLHRDPKNRSPPKAAKGGGAKQKRKINSISPPVERAPEAGRGLPTRRMSGRAARRKQAQPINQNPAPSANKTSARHSRENTEQPTMKPPSQLSQHRQGLVRYEAKIGDEGNVNPYALELISVVCNSPDSIAGNKILETPTAKYPSADDEPVNERLIRMQLRHRFFAAKAIRMSVVDFSRRLLELWGGNLLEIDERGGQQSEKVNANTQLAKTSTASQPQSMSHDNTQEAFSSAAFPSTGAEALRAAESGAIEESPMEAETIVTGTDGLLGGTPAVARSRSSDIDEDEYDTARETSVHEPAEDDYSGANAMSENGDGDDDGYDGGDHDEGNKDNMGNDNAYGNEIVGEDIEEAEEEASDNNNGDGDGDGDDDHIGVYDD